MAVPGLRQVPTFEGIVAEDAASMWTLEFADTTVVLHAAVVPCPAGCSLGCTGRVRWDSGAWLDVVLSKG
jgi:hypothetical protein